MSATKYGLIGHPLGHSLSPYIQERIMDAMGISGRYELYDIPPEDLAKDLPVLMKELDGFNCTIPFKIPVIPFLDRLDETASRYQAVNTVWKGCGYNTDREGFLSIGLEMAGKKTLILGVGGVSRMMAFEALSQKAKVYLHARNPDKAHAFAEELRASGSKDVFVISDEEIRQASDMDVLLNGTPSGMWPMCGQMPAPAGICRTGQQVFDTIYNPAATRWVLHARKNGAQAQGGIKMLFMQAVAAQKIWNPGSTFDERRWKPILSELTREMLRRFPVKYIFTGFMGAGKTTIAKEVGSMLHVDVFDLDEQIEKARGCTISEIFARDGEEGFRKTEAAILRTLLTKTGSALIATGGGAIFQQRVRDCIQEHNAIVVYLHASLDCIWSRIREGSDRPLMGNPASEEEGVRFTKAARLYEDRLPGYESECDIKIHAEKDRDAVISEVITALGYGG
jgi:shikimate dehydrogenase